MPAQRGPMGLSFVTALLWCCLNFATGGSIKQQYEAGNVLMGQQRFDSATQRYQVVTRFAPRYAEAYANLGTIAVTQAEMSKAHSRYTQAVTIKPAYPEVYLNLAVMQQQRGKISASIRQYSTLLRLIPQHSEAYANVGQLIERQVNSAPKPVDQDWLKAGINKALLHYKTAVGISPNLAHIYRAMGNLLAGQGRLKRAQQRYVYACNLVCCCLCTHA